MRNLNDLVINAQDTTTSITGSAIDASQLFQVSVIGVVTTAGTGTLKIQGSNDPVSPTVWADIATIATTGAGTYLAQKADLSFTWIRVVYIATSGTGTLTARLNAKGF